MYAYVWKNSENRYLFVGTCEHPQKLGGEKDNEDTWEDNVVITKAPIMLKVGIRLYLTEKYHGPKAPAIKHDHSHQTIHGDIIHGETIVL